MWGRIEYVRRVTCPDDDTHLPRKARSFILLLSYLYPSAILPYSSFSVPFVSFLWFVKRISITCQANQYNGQQSIIQSVKERMEIVSAHIDFHWQKYNKVINIQEKVIYI